MKTVLIEEAVWMNSQFSVARFYGGVKWNGKMYKIVNKDGITLEELSNPQSEHYAGKGNMAIPAGEPADLVLEELIPVYRKLGREKFLSLLRKGCTIEDAIKLCETK